MLAAAIALLGCLMPAVPARGGETFGDWKKGGALIAKTLSPKDYVVQVGAFSRSESAARLTGALKKQGSDDAYFQAERGLYKVRVGGFTTREKAAAQAKKLLDAGIVKSFYLVAREEAPRVTAPAGGKAGFYREQPGTDRHDESSGPAGWEEAGETPATRGCEFGPEASGEGNEIPPREADTPPAGDTAPAAAAPDGEVAADARRLDAVEARTMSRLGHYPEALRLHRELRRQYPDDLFIWEDYIETLIDYRDYEAATRELQNLAARRLLSPRAARLHARMNLENGNYERTFSILEQAIRDNMRNAGVWADYGYARQGSGDIAGALNLYAAALELDPENENTRRAIREILRDNRPRLDGGYRLYYQYGDTATQTYGGAFTAHGGNRLLVSLLYEKVRVDRPMGVYATAIQQDMTGGGVETAWRLGGGGRLFLGVMGYSGFDGRMSAWGGLEYTGRRLGKLQIFYRDNRPWYDPAEAAYHKGSVSTGSLTYEVAYRERWGLALGYEHNQYRLGDTGSYGRKDAVNIAVTRKISLKPDFYLGYSFYKSQFNYENDRYTPVSMIPSEALSSLFAGLQFAFNPYLTLNLLGGGRYDTDRSLASWYINPALLFRFRNRLEFEGGYEYNSEDRQSDGRSSTALTARARWIW